jgi:uncharacterized protein
MSTVLNNHAASRLEIYEEGELAGFVRYRTHDRGIWFLRTEILPGFQGRGLEGILISHALGSTRRRRVAALPFCPAIRKFMSSNREFVRLVPSDWRRRFGLPGLAAAAA